MRIFLTALSTLILIPLSALAIDIQEVKSKGGFTAWLVEEHSIPFVSIDISFKGGASLDLPGKRGATNLMVGLLEEGTGDMDARDFAAAAEGLAASFGFDAYNDSVSISAKMLTENRDQAVALLRRALIEPRFDQVSIDRVKSQVQSIILSDSKNPEDIASRAFSAAAFGDHPYGSGLNGTEESVEGLNRDDLIAAHHNAMAQDRIFIGASGDITPDELAALLDDLLGDLPAVGAPMPKQAEYQLTNGVTVIPYETPQSVAVFGHQGIERHDDDFFAAFILNHVFGGAGFESRLMSEVREKRGLTYGIGSSLYSLDHGQLFIGQVASSNDRMAEVITVVTDEWTRMAESGLTAEELSAAKTFLTGAYPLRFDGNSRIAGILTGMQSTGLDIAYPDTRNDKVNAVTLADIARVAKRLMRPEDLRYVVVGQPDNVENTD
ncbi:putative zinc protease [Rhodobacterales bacterium HTCC2150]|nr:putative zinc protease [Rhodobacterales bacterium HTCC2150] [Rhodobacteraceae bacterium HTCC2150]